MRARFLERVSSSLWSFSKAFNSSSPSGSTGGDTKFILNPYSPDKSFWRLLLTSTHWRWAAWARALYWFSPFFRHVPAFIHPSLATIFIREAFNVPPDWEIRVQKAIHLRDIVHREGGFQVTILVPGLKWSWIRSIEIFIVELPLANTLYNPTFGTRIGLGNIEVSWAHTCSSCTPPTMVGHNPCTFAKWWPWSSLLSWPYVPSRRFSGSFRTV